MVPNKCPAFGHDGSDGWIVTAVAQDRMGNDINALFCPHCEGEVDREADAYSCPHWNVASDNYERICEDCGEFLGYTFTR